MRKTVKAVGVPCANCDVHCHAFRVMYSTAIGRVCKSCWEGMIDVQGRILGTRTRILSTDRLFSGVGERQSFEILNEREGRE